MIPLRQVWEAICKSMAIAVTTTFSVIYNYSEGNGDDTIESFSGTETLLSYLGSYARTENPSDSGMISYLRNVATADFGANTILKINSGTYSTLTSGNDVIVKVGNGSVTLKNLSGKSFNITGNTSETNVLQSDNNIYTYSGGNKNITNYTTGEKLNWSTDLTGIDIFSGEDFIFNSSSGSLTIQNVCDKVVDFSYNGTTIAYLAKASGALDLDASSLAQFLILVGGNNASNNFSAGSGGSWLWGGSGGNDTLTGGAGADVFYFGKNDGSDFIGNASSSDVVNLYDVSINDITMLDTSDNTISIGLNTGASLQINSAENVSAKITMSEGSVNFNLSTNQWQLV